MIKKQNKKPLLSLIVILLAVIATDQATKRLAQYKLVDEVFYQETDKYPPCGDIDEDLRRERFIARHRQNITIVEGFFDLRYVENCASAFGMMSRVPESFRFPFFLIISVLAIAFIPYLYIKTPADQKLMIFALPFVLGGAIGNLLDRIIFRYVIDFIRWYITIGGKERDWPTFNLADAAIVVGIGLMLLQMFPRRRTDQSAERADLAP